MKTNIEDNIVEQVSDCTSRKIAEQSFSLAKAMGAEVVLLHVTSDSANYSPSERVTIMGFTSQKNNISLLSECTDELKNAGQHFIDKSTHKPGDFTIKMMVKEADFAESILKAAKDLHVELMFWAQSNGDNV